MTYTNSVDAKQNGVQSVNNGVWTGSAITQFDTLVGGASNAIVSIAPGTTGQVLTSNGAGANPSYQSGSSGGISTINGDTGSASGSTVTFTQPVAGGNLHFSGSGSTMTLQTYDPTLFNTFIGNTVGNATGTGSFNYGFGQNIMSEFWTTGSYNCAFGETSLAEISSGNYNTAFGYLTLYGLSTGSYNLGIGYSAGDAYIAAESSNICILNNGVAGENNTIHIGTQGSGPFQQNACYIAGITGATVTGSAVLCDTNGKLGTIVSSERFKDNIADLGDESSPIMNLRPVSFDYKSDKSHSYGLIAEEVENLMPELVIRDQKGRPMSVKYHELPALLLNELQKLQKRIEYLEGKCVCD